MYSTGKFGVEGNRTVLGKARYGGVEFRLVETAIPQCFELRVNDATAGVCSHRRASRGTDLYSAILIIRNVNNYRTGALYLSSPLTSLCSKSPLDAARVRHILQSGATTPVFPLIW